MYGGKQDRTSRLGTSQRQSQVDRSESVTYGCSVAFPPAI